MMRREQEITDRGILESILDRAQVCRIGLSHNNVPYVVPVCFGYRDNCLYIHSARDGKKIEIIRENNSVCFEAEIDVELIRGERACDFAMQYQSVIGFGTAHLIEDEEEKIHALHILMDHYSEQPSHEYRDKVLPKVAIIKIEVDTMTGKRSRD
jgi:nitroimidazol reductase NimA-like FMN-containing flavoprotein (pyridoxamine 5'-phosphate oxidase superfamily)